MQQVKSYEPDLCHLINSYVDIQAYLNNKIFWEKFQYENDKALNDFNLSLKKMIKSYENVWK